MKKLLLGTIFAFVLYVSAGFACVCADDPDTSLKDKVKWAVDNGDSIFIGTLERFDFISGVPNEFNESLSQKMPGLTWETKTVIFGVAQYWKGVHDPEVTIVTETTRNSDGTSSTTSCEYPFEEGKTYLVFAKKVDGYLRNQACSYTRRDDQIKEILPLLGESKKPPKPKT